MPLPTKTRELHSHHFDSTIWNDFQFRDDDIVIATYGKSGTTWMQQPNVIRWRSHAFSLGDVAVARPPRAAEAGEVACGGSANAPAFRQDAFAGRRTGFSPRAKYIYIGRDNRDVVWSLYNHHSNANQKWYDALNLTPGLVGPPIEPPPADIRQYWHDWLDRDGFPFWSPWENIRSWREIRDLPNVTFVHFNQLKRDLPGQMRRLSAFLDIKVDESRWPAILEYCSFDWMKRNATKSVPLGGAFWDAGAEVFVNKGVNGRWTEVFSPAESAEYEARAIAELGPACATWLATGVGLD